MTRATGKSIWDRRLSNERRSYAVCQAAFEKLAGDDGSLAAIALRNIGKWERDKTCGGWYIERWRELLSVPIAQAQAVVLAFTDEGAALRQNHPFAGFFTETERQALRRVSIEEVAARPHH